MYYIAVVEGDSAMGEEMMFGAAFCGFLCLVCKNFNLMI